jgi:HlyD family secretion protein
MEVETMKKKLFTLIILAAVAGILSACANSKAQTDSATTVVPVYTLIAEGHLAPVRAIDLSFQVPGTVAEVLVKDGQSVTEGTVLARLSNNADALLALAQAQQEALSASQALDDIQNSTLSGSEAALALAQAQTDYNNALGNYWNSTQTQGSQDQIDATRAKLTILDNKIGDLEDRLSKMAETPDSDVKKAQVKQDLAQARIDRQNLQDLLNYYEAIPDPLKVDTLKAELDVAKAKLDDAQRAYDRVVGGIDPNILQAAQARVTTANAAVASAEAALAATEVRASIAGTVVDPSIIPGQQVAASEIVMSLADTSAWVVETTNLTEADVVNITLGQKVDIVLDALPDVTLEGTVTHISSRFEEQRGDITYAVTVTLTQTDPRMRWGMTAAVKFLP